MENLNLRQGSYAVAIASVVLAVTIPGFQAEELPVVDARASDRTRIEPAGGPIAEAPQGDADGFIRVGDWDVKIWGSLPSTSGPLRRATVGRPPLPSPNIDLIQKIRPWRYFSSAQGLFGLRPELPVVLDQFHLGCNAAFSRRSD